MKTKSGNKKRECYQTYLKFLDFNNELELQKSLEHPIKLEKFNTFYISNALLKFIHVFNMYLFDDMYFHLLG